MMTAVNPGYARHLTETDRPFPVRQETCNRPKWYSDGARVTDLSVCLRRTW